MSIEYELNANTVGDARVVTIYVYYACRGFLSSLGNNISTFTLYKVKWYRKGRGACNCQCMDLRKLGFHAQLSIFRIPMQNTFGFRFSRSTVDKILLVVVLVLVKFL